MLKKRFPQWVYRHGQEPDPRFTLANERTFLAWIRTGLGLIAAGVALEAIALSLDADFKRAASIALLTMGAVIPAVAWWQWGRTERALRSNQALPSSPLSGLLACGILLAGIFLGLATATG